MQRFIGEPRAVIPDGDRQHAVCYNVLGFDPAGGITRRIGHHIFEHLHRKIRIDKHLRRIRGLARAERFPVMAGDPPGGVIQLAGQERERVSRRLTGMSSSF